MQFLKEFFTVVLLRKAQTAMALRMYVPGYIDLRTRTNLQEFLGDSILTLHGGQIRFPGDFRGTLKVTRLTRLGWYFCQHCFVDYCEVFMNFCKFRERESCTCVHSEVSVTVKKYAAKIQIHCFKIQNIFRIQSMGILLTIICSKGINILPEITNKAPIIVIKEVK